MLVLAGELVGEWIGEGMLTKEVGAAVGTATGIVDGEKVAVAVGASDSTELLGELEDSVGGLEAWT